MKLYAAIDHYKGADNKGTQAIVYRQNTKKSFMQDCQANGFVPYVVLTETMLDTLLNKDGAEVFAQVKKLTSNYRVWNEVTDYITSAGDIIAAKKGEYL